MLTPPQVCVVEKYFTHKFYTFHGLDSKQAKNLWRATKHVLDKLGRIRHNFAVIARRLSQLIRRWYRYHGTGFELGHVLPREEPGRLRSLPCRGAFSGTIEVEMLIGEE